MAGFQEIARQAFAFLEDEYGFSIQSSPIRGGGDSLTYTNITKGVAVKLEYERADAFVFVVVYQLVNGEMRDNAWPITDDSAIHCFDFNDVLPDDEKMKPAYLYGEGSRYFDENEGLARFVTDFAVRLRKHGGAVLSGDFSVLAEVERIIRHRAQTG